MVVIFGVLHKNLSGLQGPLASLDVAVHVQYHLGRCRLAATNLAFSDSHAISTEYKLKLKLELSLLQQEYDTLLFGGPMRLMVRACRGRACIAPMAFDPHHAHATINNLLEAVSVHNPVWPTKHCPSTEAPAC